MASGSQKWKGSWAALVNAETAMSTPSVPVRPGRCAHTSEARMPDRLVVPAAVAETARAVSRVSPPKKVRIRVRMEPASPPEPERAMSMNEAMETSSQPTKSTVTSSASTSRTTASVNAVIRV